MSNLPTVADTILDGAYDPIDDATADAARAYCISHGAGDVLEALGLAS